MNTLSYKEAEKMMQLFTERYVQKDLAAFLDLFADDIIFEFPYAQAPNPKRLNGKAAMQQYLERLADVLEIHSFTSPIIHVSANSPVFFAQFEAHGTNLEKGSPYEQHYISVVQVKDGKIARYQDYWNPLAI